jgi:uridine kinase
MFTSPHRIEPRDNVILCGLHTLYSENIRGLTDIKIYMDTDPDLTTEWKLRRDVGERGHTRDSVLQKIRERADDFARYIRPQREFADLIIRYHAAGLELSIRRTFSVPHIAGCILTQDNTFYKVTCTNPDISVDSEVATFLRERRLPHIPPQSGYAGVIQLVILAMLYK